MNLHFFLLTEHVCLSVSDVYNTMCMWLYPPSLNFWEFGNVFTCLYYLLHPLSILLEFSNMFKCLYYLPEVCEMSVFEKYLLKDVKTMTEIA